MARPVKVTTGRGKGKEVGKGRGRGKRACVWVCVKTHCTKWSGIEEEKSGKEEPYHFLLSVEQHK